MENKKIKVTVKGSESIDLKKIEPFQGNLKHIEKDEYEKLRKTIIDFGFSFVVHVWKNKGKNYIIDGHQRLFTLKQMVEVEGYEVGAIPCAIVSARSFAEAKRKVLAAASQFGKMTKESLALYLKENEIPFDEVVANFHFVEIDLKEMTDQFAKDIDDAGVENFQVEPDEEEEEEDTEKGASGSSQVKQIQLFFTLTDYSEFVTKIENLKVHYNKQNISDTLLEIVRANYRA